MNILSIDQGTTSTRAFIFNSDFQIVSVAQKEFTQHFPHSGWVEHDPEEIWQSVLDCCNEVVQKAGVTFSDITCIGITNQRETTVVWDKKTGEVIFPAIVWQDRRTSDYCRELKKNYSEKDIQKKTGLLLDPYFSASKIQWILNHVDNGKMRAQAGELAFGTIDSFLLWRLTGGKVHATDVTNASRTLLMDIQQLQWDQKLLQLFDVPDSMLPEIKNNADDFGVTDANLFGVEIPICAMVGDQQGALVGQACLQPGMVKSTYGTGCFAILNTGGEIVQSKNRLLSTVAFRTDKTQYALEGSIFSAGVNVEWMRDNLKLISSASETEAIVNSIDDTGGVYFVPAFTGLGAPYWNPDVRAAIFGMSRGTETAHIVRAGLESIAYQTKDLLDAMIADGAISLTEIRVDGGMVKNNWLMQFLADILDVPVVRPTVTETTVLGAAFLAAVKAGQLAMNDINNYWHEESRFTPQMTESKRDDLFNGWQRAVAQTLRSV